MTTQEEQWAAEAKANEAKAKRNKWIAAGVVAALLVLVAILKAAGVIKSDEEKCAERGVAFFKEIGSYPYLSNGASAEKEAKERCSRSLKAFPE